RHVSIPRMRDVDVFSKLPELPPDVDPAALQQLMLRTLLTELDEERIEPQGRSIQVLSPTPTCTWTWARAAPLRTPGRSPTGPCVARALPTTIARPWEGSASSSNPPLSRAFLIRPSTGRSSSPVRPMIS